MGGLREILKQCPKQIFRFSHARIAMENRFSKFGDLFFRKEIFLCCLHVGGVGHYYTCWDKDWVRSQTLNTHKASTYLETNTRAWLLIHQMIISYRSLTKIDISYHVCSSAWLSYGTELLFKVYDGENAHAPLLEMFTGGTGPDVISTGPYLFLDFTSDHIIPSKGFKLRYMGESQTLNHHDEFKSC